MMFFEQISVGGDNNLAYLIADEASKEACVVDPSFAPEKVLQLADQHGLGIKYLINTHNHYDHTNGNEYILTHTKAILVDTAKHDAITIGKLKLKIIKTPGHSTDSICILVANKLMTGDTLFIGYVGRVADKTAAQAEYESLHNKIMVLPDAVEVYPGHDYGTKPSSTIAEERQTNPYIRCKTLAAFIELRCTQS